MNGKLPFSVLILTKNEEERLPACLRSVARCDDVVVLDSGSTDRTAEIAVAMGARIFQNPFRDFAQQRNHGMETIPFRHPWVFHLDADEQMLPDLVEECAAIPATADCDGFYAAPRMMFHGVWLKRCTDFPAWQARCVRVGRFRFVQAGHGQREAPGMRMDFLRGTYLHDISVPDLAAWERKHRRYAREEAEAFLAEGDTPLAPLWRGPALARRRTLKRLSYALPARPFLRFVYQYVLRLGALDGAMAWRYCRLLARYERFASAALSELRRSRRA